MLSKGVNRMGGDHAEAVAVRSFARRRKKEKVAVDVLVVRAGTDGKLAMSKPCPSCVGVLANVPNLRHVYYTDRSSRIQKVRFDDLVS